MKPSPLLRSGTRTSSLRATPASCTNLAILDDWVNSSEHFFYTKPQAGTTALVYYDFDIPSYDFCTRMYHETGAFVTPGDCF